MLLFSNRSFFHTISFHFSLLYLPFSVYLGSGNEVGISGVGSAPWSNRPSHFTSFFSISHLASVWGLGMRYVSLELGRPHGATDPFLHLSYSCVRSAPWSNRPCDLLANTFETTKSSFFWGFRFPYFYLIFSLISFRVLMTYFSSVMRWVHSEWLVMRRIFYGTLILGQLRYKRRHRLLATSTIKQRSPAFHQS